MLYTYNKINFNGGVKSHLSSLEWRHSTFNIPVRASKILYFKICEELLRLKDWFIGQIVKGFNFSIALETLRASGQLLQTSTPTSVPIYTIY